MRSEIKGFGTIVFEILSKYAEIRLVRGLLYQLLSYYIVAIQYSTHCDVRHSHYMNITQYTYCVIFGASSRWHTLKKQLNQGYLYLQCMMKCGKTRNMKQFLLLDEIVT